jgi:hypothetical protein
MAFPSSPIDGQVEVVNNIKYTFKASANAWYRLAVSTATTISSENVYVIGSTDSSSTNTGALLVGGGAGIVGNLHVGGTITAEGGFAGLNATRIFENTSSVTVIDNTVTQQISLIVADVTATLITSTLTQINTVVSITNTSSSTSTDSGALTVNGGVGIGENLYVKGVISAEGGFLGLNANSIYQNTSSVTVIDTGSVSQVVITIADTTNTTFSQGLVDINADLDVNSVRWKNSTTNAVSVYQVYNHVTQSLDTIFV